MYNRYTPRPDGSFSRSRCAEPNPPPRRSAPRSTPPEPPCPPPEPEHKSNDDHCKQQKSRQGPPSSRSNPTAKNDSRSVSAFLRQLLPKDFDTSDFMIVLLLLLMAGDCAEDQNTALLTLALYFFM